MPAKKINKTPSTSQPSPRTSTALSPHEAALLCRRRLACGPLSTGTAGIGPEVVVASHVAAGSAEVQSSPEAEKSQPRPPPTASALRGMMNKPAVPTSLFGQSVLNVVESRVGTAGTRTTQEAAVSAEQAFGMMQDLVGDMWADSTLTARQNLWRRFVQWCEANAMERTADSASLWVLATSTSRQAQLSYAKALSGTMKHSGFDNQPLKSLASALRAAGAAVPLKQASPMLKEDLLMWVDQEGDPHLRLAGLVAWKTCSRWGEVHQLTSAQFILVSPAEVIIDWHQTPKGRRSDPYKPSKLVVVVGDLTSRIAELFAVCAPFQQLTKVDADGVARIWKRMWSGMDWTGPYTGHSVKRGALGHILRAMAAGAQVREELVSRVCKHATLAGLSNQTIRYGSGTKADLISLARAMETAKVTCLL